jgi:hypothetical protein
MPTMVTPRPRYGGIRALAALAAAASLLAGVVDDASAQPAYSAAFVSQTVPSFIAQGVATNVSITMQNTGTATWVRAQGDVFLATQEPQDNFYWCIQDNIYGSQSGNRVVLPNDVYPNAQVTFNFTVNPLSCRFAAPAPFRFRMLSEAHGTFGEETPNAMVAVSNAASFVSQQVPAVVPAGASIWVTETYQNTTNATWQTTDGYTLNSAVPAGNNTWGTTSVPLPAAVAPMGDVTFSFAVVTPSTPGTYNFQWQPSTAQGVSFGDISPATSVQVVAAGPPNYGGLWWNRPAGSESGWGINLAHEADTIFMTWFTYDLTGKGVWMSMTATLNANNVYAGALQQSTGPVFSAVPFTPAKVQTSTVGSGTLTFTDANNGSFAYIVNGITQTKPITREVFGQLPTCTYNLVTDLTTAYNYQDLWWAAPAGVESGWGVNLTHQGDVIFLTWFTYDVDSSPLWLFASMPKTALGAYGGTVYRTTGPPFNSTPFDPTKVVATSVGTATLTFTDGNNGTFMYTVNGITQSKAITRQILVAPGTVCQ